MCNRKTQATQAIRAQSFDAPSSLETPGTLGPGRVAMPIACSQNVSKHRAQARSWEEVRKANHGLQSFSVFQHAEGLARPRCQRFRAAAYAYSAGRAVTYTHDPAVTCTQKFLVTCTHAHA